jgi:sugar lactone lactonase YvrE
LTKSLTDRNCNSTVCSLLVADTSNNLILQYTPTKANAGDPTLVVKSGQAASAVMGQSAFTTSLKNSLDGRGLDLSGFNTGTVTIDKSAKPNRVYVADYVNNRVLAWKDIAVFNTRAPANLVFGQPDFGSNIVNNGGISNKSLNSPSGIAVDNAGNLYISDQGNNRVLQFKTPFTTDTTADMVFGQSGSFITGGANSISVNADSLNAPIGLAVDSGNNLYVADYSNHRVLEFNKNPATDTTADKVFGQLNNFFTALCNSGGITADSLCQPFYVTVSSTDDVYISDFNNHRVHKYRSPLTTNRTADRVFGQGASFTVGGCKTISPTTLCNPEGVALDSADNLYVMDAGNNRVLQYLKP